MPENATTIDGHRFAAALQTASRWLDQNAEAVNALNVFPVPDGDTGLNMSLTLKSASESMDAARSESLGEAVGAMARGALMGSRGNSGVILAHIFRGFARELTDVVAADGPTLARALTAGADNAYTEVAAPVEGTILTVARRAAEAATVAAAESELVTGVIEAAHAAAKLAVADTPNLLPILKQASVVDAGGEGFRLVFQGLLMHLRGEELPAAVEVSAWADLSSLHQEDGDFFGYCTEVLFQGVGLDVESTRARVSALGTSILVVGDPEMIKLHVHTERPGAVLDLATELGELVRVKIDNMQLQHQQFATVSGRAVDSSTIKKAPRLPQSGGVTGTTVVAVVSGEGMEKIFRGLGACVIAGGSTMNPSVEEIAEAIRSAAADEILILPNNKNVIMAAQQARSLASDRAVQVVPTRNMPQGIAALLALNPEMNAASNLPTLTAAADRCHAIEIARASRDAEIDGVTIRANGLMAMLDDHPAAAGESYLAVLETALAKLEEITPDAVTIYVGSEGTTEGAAELATMLRTRFGIEPDVLDGGQPHYQYIVSLE